jgi:hypothetical protein
VKGLGKLILTKQPHRKVTMNREQLQTLEIGSIVECVDGSTYKVTYVRLFGQSIDVSGEHTENSNLLLSGSFTYGGKQIGKQSGKAIVNILQKEQQ